jgi:polysaccharide biosynthesis transport protein
MESEDKAVSVAQALGILRRRALWILLCAVLAAAAAYGYSKQQTKQYTATGSLSFSSNPLSQQIAGLSSGGGNSNLVAQQASNVEHVKLGDMAAKTAATLGHGLTGQKVSSSLSVSAQGESGVVAISATATSPALAAAIANTYAKQFVSEQQSSTRQFFKSALTLVNEQLARLTPAQRFGSDGVDLEERAHTLGLLSELQFGNVQIAQEALASSTPTSPKTKRNTVIGLILGLLLGLGVAFLLERLDQRIREPEELQRIYRLPMLGVVPRSSAFARSARQDGTPLPAIEAEAFGLIRAHLRFFNIDRDLRAVVIASPAPGDGKTTVARHLAEAAARLGSRVLLLEVDLRHPTLAQQLAIAPGPGLADVLIGATSIEQAINSVALSAVPGEGVAGHKLDVLVAGSVLPPNPGELLESRAMEVVLAQAKAGYDLVVIDTPPLTAVPDAFPLLTKVDGVIIVGSVGRSRRDAAEELHRVLASSGAPLLGVIANYSPSGGPSAYPGYGKSSASSSSPNGTSAAVEQAAPTANV